MLILPKETVWSIFKYVREKQVLRCAVSIRNKQNYMLEKLVKNKGHPCKVNGNNHKLGDYPITQDNALSPQERRHSGASVVILYLVSQTN